MVFHKLSLKSFLNQLSPILFYPPTEILASPKGFILKKLSKAKTFITSPFSKLCLKPLQKT